MSRPASCCFSQRQRFLKRRRRGQDALHHRHCRLGRGRQVDHGAHPARSCCAAGRRARKVDLVTTDGFLYPNEVLRRENLMDRKGFPESYDVGALLRFLSAHQGRRSRTSARRSIRT